MMMLQQLLEGTKIGVIVKETKKAKQPKKHH
jgi:hypothetical protein